MRLYIGGAYQGKKEYAMSVFPDACIVEGQSVEECRYDRGFIVKDLHLYIRDRLAEGDSETVIEDKVLKIAKQPECLAIICNEVGSGVVPIEKEERVYRDVCGHIMTKLAAMAESVERIVCGIAVKIK